MRRALIFFSVLLGGCALIAPPPLPAVRPLQPELVPFAMNGRISVSQQGNRQAAGLRWIHQPQTDEILLLTPLGQTVARIYSDPGRATLDNGDRHYQADDPESLMQQALGWYLPLSQLHHWLLGMAERGLDAQIERNEAGQIVVLNQGGWEVRYLSYTSGRPDSLPKRMQLCHGDLQVQLLIDEWVWNPR